MEVGVCVDLYAGYMCTALDVSNATCTYVWHATHAHVDTYPRFQVTLLVFVEGLLSRAGSIMYIYIYIYMCLVNAMKCFRG